MFTYTGCDAVSAFAGRGKAHASKVVKNNKECHKAFAKLGKEWDISSQLIDRLGELKCLLYSPKSSTKKVNDLRHQLFCEKET